MVSGYPRNDSGASDDHRRHAHTHTDTHQFSATVVHFDIHINTAYRDIEGEL